MTTCSVLRCSVVQPSRELAEQTCVQLQKFKKHLKNPTVRDLLIIGGVAAREQVDALEKGVSIGTAVHKYSNFCLPLKHRKTIM